MRFASKGWLLIAAAAVVALMAQVSLAQREGGRGGRGFGGGMGGPPTPARLLMLKEVQDALKLTDDQKDKLKQINDDMRDALRKAMDDGSGREKMQELMASTTTKVNEVLDEGQQKRLLGIFVQVNGANAALDPGVAKELNVTDDQKKKLADIRQKNMESMRDLFQSARDQEGGREAMREKMDKLREEESKAMMEVLTAEQQKDLEALKGEKVEVDLSQLRGPVGRGGQPGDRPRGERGGRNRGGEEKSNN
ncbi:MAG: hypothetical protein U0805_08210 [Pirellulales bacterium]